MPYTILMPVVAKKILHGGPNTLGFLMASTGTGALLGALYLASRKSVLGLGRVIFICTVIRSRTHSFFLFPLSVAFHGINGIHGIWHDGAACIGKYDFTDSDR
jgi:hypothetical protein